MPRSYRRLVPMTSIAARLAEELKIQVRQVEATIALLDEKATVPFIARYRKEATGGLDDTQLRLLDERLTYLRELDARRETILKSIEEQGKLTPELAAAIAAADTKARLEDLYLPYKPKRRTKAQIARDAGLEPLAIALLARSRRSAPDEAATRFVDAEKGVPDVAAALEGARWILVETVRRGRGADRRAAPAAVGPWRVDVHRRAWQGGGGRQVLRLLRRVRAAAPRAVTSGARAVPRATRRHPAPERGPAAVEGRHRPRGAGASHRQALGMETRGRPPMRGSPRRSAWRGSSRS